MNGGENHGNASAPWLLIVLLGVILIIAVVVLAIIGIISLVARKPVLNSYLRELADLQAEVAQLRDEVRDLTRGRTAGKSTDITNRG